MANIEISNDIDLIGTTSDDVVTLDSALAPTTAVTLDGNGGDDTLVLSDNTIADFVGATEELSYNSSTQEWTLDDNTGAAGEVIASNAGDEGFNKVQLADGTVLEAGTATSGIIAVAPAAGSNSVDLDSSNVFYTYAWNGFSLEAGSGDALDVDTVVSVDGIDVAAAGNNFTNSDGAFELSGATLDFIPNAAAVAAQGNPGETATFSYDIVVADTDGVQTTVTLTFSFVIEFSEGDDTFVGEAEETHDEDGLGGNDMMTGAELNDTLDGDDGNDTLYGLAGDDTLDGGEGDDMLDGGEGRDELYGREGNDNIMGGDGDDSVAGGDDNDTVRGGDGKDNILGDDGDDELRGGAGDDTLNGGADNDELIGAGGADLLIGGTGNDTLTGGGNTDGTEDTLSGGDGDDRLNGGDGNDILDGGANNDDLRGGDGDDILVGGTGDDELRGGAGDDTLEGGDGADEFRMGAADEEDTMVLSDTDDAIDTIILKADAGNAVVTGFDAADDSSSEDLLDVSGLGITDLDGVLAIAYEGDDAGAKTTVIEIDEDTSLVLDGVDIADLDATDFIFAS